MARTRNMVADVQLGGIGGGCRLWHTSNRLTFICKLIVYRECIIIFILCSFSFHSLSLSPTLLLTHLRNLHHQFLPVTDVRCTFDLRPGLTTIAHTSVFSVGTTRSTTIASKWFECRFTISCHICKSISTDIECSKSNGNARPTTISIANADERNTWHSYNIRTS